MTPRCVLALLALAASTPLLAAPVDPPRIRWAFQTEGPVRGAVALDEEAVYAGSSDGHLYALGKQDGALRWKAAVDGPVAGAPAIAGDLVIVSGRSRNVVAVSRESGARRWTFRMGETLATPTSWSYFTAPPVIDGDRVLVGSGDGHLYALDAASGAQRWAFRTGDSIRAAPRVDGDRVYVASGDDHVYALDAASGRERWKFATRGVGYDLSQGFIRSDIFTRPQLSRDLLIFGSRDANVYAVDLETHRARWTFAYDSTWAMSATVANDTAFIGWSTNNKVNALDVASGRQKWEYQADSHTYTAAVVREGVVYWASANGELLALDEHSGKLRWKYSVGADVYSSPQLEGDTLYFGTDDGRILSVGSGAAEVHRAFYLPAEVPAPIRGFVVDDGLAEYFVARGYQRLDSAAALGDWIAARTQDGAPSVVVFGFALIPAPVVGEDAANGPLRGYLQAGGKVLWPWGIPNQYRFDDAGKFVAYQPDVARQLLGLKFLGFEDSGNYYARATQAGRNWGMPAWLRTTFASLEPGSDVTALALDEYGRVSAFVKSFGARPGTGWVSFSPSSFGVPFTPGELALMARIAEYGVR